MKIFLMMSLAVLTMGQALADKAAKRKAKPFELEEIVLNKELWSMSPSAFEKKYKQNGFVFMSAQKKDLRAEGHGFSLFGIKAGEVVLRSDQGRISDVSISLYNRGDSGPARLMDYPTSAGLRDFLT